MKSSLSLSLFYLVIFFPGCLHAQQNYAGLDQQNCDLTSPSTLGYKYNGAPSCPSYIIYRPAPSQKEEDTKHLLNALPCNTKIGVHGLPIFPFVCYRSSNYYQHNATYTVNDGDTYYNISKYLYQGLTSCKALMNQNPQVKPWMLTPGIALVVPLRCACPTPEQAKNGIKHLVTYPIVKGDNITSIAKMFKVDVRLVLSANNLLANEWIYPYTTILVPIRQSIDAEVADM